MYKRWMKVVVGRRGAVQKGRIENDTNRGVTSAVMAEAFRPETFWFRVCSVAVPHVDGAARGVSAIA